jgi:UrcA family protein
MNRNEFTGMLVAAALALSSLPAVAAQPPTVNVPISDLDLSTARGQQALERRLKAAIARVCIRPNEQLPRTIAVQQRVHACMASARDGALLQLQVHGIQVARAAR